MTEIVLIENIPAKPAIYYLYLVNKLATQHIHL